jgi:dolichol-phosphate mannosyltransferase
MSPSIVSVILPTYNESASIVRFLTELREVMEAAGVRFELLLSDDGSPDGTASLVEGAFPDRERIRVIRRSGPRGLAFSVREGIERSRGDLLVVMDADFNHDPVVVPYLVKYLEDFDLVSGSRFSSGGGMYSRIRHYGSFAVNLFLRIVLRTQVQDSLAGFFAIRRADLFRLPLDEIFWGHGDYFFRLLFYAQRRGIRILEIPVYYPSRQGGDSKTPLFRTAFHYFKEIVLLRLRYFRSHAEDRTTYMTYRRHGGTTTEP